MIHFWTEILQEVKFSITCLFDILHLTSFFTLLSLTEANLTVKIINPDPISAYGNITGILRVTMGGMEGRICGDGFDDLDAKVACKSMGFKGGVAYKYTLSGSPKDEQSQLPLLTSGLSCVGNETSLEECPRRDFTTSGTCSGDAGVLCYNQGNFYVNLPLTFTCICMILHQPSRLSLCKLAF